MKSQELYGEKQIKMESELKFYAQNVADILGTSSRAKD
jgi:hypothetical protein